MPVKTKKKSKYIPYVLDKNNIPKNGLVIKLPTKISGSVDTRRLASTFGVENTKLPHNGHYISWLPPERITDDAIKFLNSIESIRNERSVEYWCEMKWEDILHGDKNFPFKVCIGKLKVLGEPCYMDRNNPYLKADVVSESDYIGAFDFVNQVFSHVDDSLENKINSLVGNDCLKKSEYGEYYIDGSCMTESIWNILVQERWMSGFVGYLNPNRIKEAKVKICWEHGPRKPYRKVRIIFGRELFALWS